VTTARRNAGKQSMIGKSKCFMIAVAVTFTVIMPAFAQSTARPSSTRPIVVAPRTPVVVDRNNPAITGGGSLGYNQTVEHGW
jgi:hypothetical protein